MKRYFLTICFVTICSLLNLFGQNSEDDRDEWYAAKFETADSLIEEGLPRDAEAIYNLIFERAKSEKYYEALLTVINSRMVNRCYFEENALLNVIEQLKGDIGKLDYPVNQVAHSILGNLYWHYLEQNRWRIYDRTTIASNENLNIESWDVKRIVQETIREIDLSLANPLKLQATPVDIFENILDGNNDYRSLRPTLYDLLSHRAISMFSNEEVGVTVPMESFVIYDPIFYSPSKEFATYQLTTNDSTSLEYRIVWLYQELTRYHLNDKSDNALADLELNRLKYIHSKSTHPYKDSLYRAALTKLADNTESRAMKAEVLYHLALFIYSLDNGGSTNYLQESLALCKKAEKDFGKTEGSGYFKSLELKIHEPSISLEATYQVHPNKPFLVKAKFKNVDTLYFRLYKVNAKYYSDRDNYTSIETLQKWSTYREWVQPLPKVNDYREHTVELPVSAVEEGFYSIVVSDKKELSHNANVNRVLVNATSLFAMSKRSKENNSMAISIANSITGVPLSKVNVEFFEKKYNYTTRSYYDNLLCKTVTDKEGVANCSGSNSSVSLVASIGGDTLYGPSTYLNSYYRSEYTSNRTVLFTDRAIYRPGQTVYFKGLVLKSSGQSAEIVPNKEEEITFEDPNGEKVSSVRARTNQYGTFNGSFVIPTGLLNGYFSLYCNSGGVSIRVEEYKRPTFEVRFTSPEKTYGFNDSVSIDGVAKAYAGYAIDNGKVSYRVSRKAESRWWWDYFSDETKQVAVGTTTTDKDGKFRISYFTDDRDILDKDMIYTYTLVAEVIDANGETRSANHTLRISKTPLLIKSTLPEVYSVMNPTDVTVQALNLDGKAIKAEIDISIIKLEAPKTILFDRPWNTPDVFAIDEIAFRASFPNRVYRDEAKPETWTDGKVVLSKKLNLGDKGINLNESLSKFKSAYYRVKISAKDSSNTTATWSKVFRLVQDSPQKPQCAKDWIIPIKISGEPGEFAEFWVSSLTPGTPIKYELLLGDSILVAKWLYTGKKVEKIVIPIEERFRGGFAVQFVQVAEGQSFVSFHEVKVPFTNKQLDISFTSFRNKLIPGEQEQWTLNIKNKKGEKEMAEMLATLYDASLDAFSPLRWETEFYKFRDHSWLKWNGNYVPSLANTVWLANTNSYLSDWSKSYEYLSWDFGYYGGYNRYYHDMQYRLKQKRRNEDIKNEKAKTKDKNEQVQGVSYEKMVAFNDSLINKAGATLVTVSGNITDESDGMPFPGVSVSVIGTSSGTATDMDGKFSLKIPLGTYIQVSCIGFKTQSIQVLSESINVKLEAEAQQVEEVVVTGYGAKRESMSDVSASVKFVAPVVVASAEVADDFNAQKENVADGSATDLTKIETRKNFNETAFFYPDLVSDVSGNITINFTIPEALTRWNMLGFAHTKDLKTGTISNELITQKDVSIMVNAPRFLREADTIEFAAKVNNLSDKDISGVAMIQLIDPYTEKSLDSALLQSSAEVSFNLSKGQSSGIRWKLVIPKGIEAVTYRVLAKAGKYTDGEEATLPVLLNSKLVTESLPFMVRAKQAKEFRFDKMIDQKSTTLRNKAYTIEFTSNPAWYAIQAMPYLMEFPYECSEQLFSRFFANSISTAIMNSSPRIKEVFNRWSATNSESLISNLEKNQELKELLLQETPWVLDSKNESERKRRVALLFDMNQMSNSLKSAFNKLKMKQTPNGGFAWFDGMPDNRYITQLIVTGLGQLDHLNALQKDYEGELDNMTKIAMNYLDARIIEDYNRLLDLSRKGLIKLDDDHISMLQIQYLYSKSFFAPVKPNKELLEAYNYFYKQAKTYWLLKDLYAQGMLALTFKRSADKEASKVIKSLSNRAKRSEELGMYWPQNQLGYYWYQSPIETQAMLIEAFHEVAADTASMEEMKIWLLRNKQTSDWKTTKATAAACYALLLRGVNLIADTRLLDVTIGGKSLDKLKDIKAEAGTGYVKTTFGENEIRNEMGEIKVYNPNNGIAWGAAYWQYFEQLDKITASQTNLKIDKKLFLKQHTGEGAILKEINPENPIKVGDEVVVRIEIRADRDFEYVHLKDMRASGFEPISTLSQYKYQDGLGYYESVKDASVNFFMDYMRKGVYVFEYSLRAVHSGYFSNGITTMQSMYAPEFNSHSQGIRIEIKEQKN